MRTLFFLCANSVIAALLFSLGACANEARNGGASALRCMNAGEWLISFEVIGTADNTSEPVYTINENVTGAFRIFVDGSCVGSGSLSTNYPLDEDPPYPTNMLLVSVENVLQPGSGERKATRAPGLVLRNDIASYEVDPSSGAFTLVVNSATEATWTVGGTSQTLGYSWGPFYRPDGSLSGPQLVISGQLPASGAGGDSVTYTSESNGWYMLPASWSVRWNVQRVASTQNVFVCLTACNAGYWNFVQYCTETFESPALYYCLVAANAGKAACAAFCRTYLGPRPRPPSG